MTGGRRGIMKWLTANYFGTCSFVTFYCIFYSKQYEFLCKIYFIKGMPRMVMEGLSITEFDINQSYIFWPFSRETFFMRLKAWLTMSYYIECTQDIYLIRKLMWYILGICKPGPWFNIKTVFLRYGDSHVKDKAVAKPSYLNLGIPILVISLYWDGSQKSKMYLAWWCEPWYTCNTFSYDREYPGAVILVFGYISIYMYTCA